jgi:hypothetical protein
MNKFTFLQKFIACFVAGLVLVAALLVLGRTLPSPLIIPEMVFGLAGLSLLIALIYPFIWQRKDAQNAANSDKIMHFWQGIIRYVLAFDISIFGFKKIFLQQFIVPYSMYDEKISNLSGEWLTWHYFGFSYTFGLIVAVAQIGGAILLLFRKTRLLGVILLLPVLLNILFINLFYGLNAGATLQSIVLSLGLIYLFSLDFKRVLSFLFDVKDGLKNGELWGRGVQYFLRFATIFIPFALVFSTYYFEIKPDKTSGIYEVKNLHTISNSDKVILITKFYLERGGQCSVQYNETHKREGSYTFEEKNNRLTIILSSILSSNEQQNDTLIGSKIRENGKEFVKMTGKWAKKDVDFTLEKTR